MVERADLDECISTLEIFETNAFLYVILKLAAE